MMSSEGNFVVLPASSQEDYDFVTKMCKDDKWHNIGVHSINHFKQWKPGFFIGYLKGQRIGSLGVFENTDVSGSIFHVGFFMVDKQFRGQGYGMKIIGVVLKTFSEVKEKGNVFLVSEMAKMPFFEKFGFRQEWLTKEYTLLSSKVLESLGKATESSLEIKPLNDIEFEKLLEYDSTVLGFSRREFLQRWITIPEFLAWAATTKTGDIVGYILIQQSVTEKQQTVGPFYADDLHVTRALLLKAAQEAIVQRSAEKLRLWLPASANPETAKMIETEIDCESIREFMTMYTKGVPPNTAANKIVGVTSAAFAT